MRASKKTIISAALMVTLMLLCIGLLQTIGVSAAESKSGLSEEYQYELYQAKVLELVNETSYETSEGITTIQTWKVKITNRNYKGREVTVTKTVGDTLVVKKGDSVVVRLISEDGGVPEFALHSHDRTIPLIILCSFFILCVLILGRLKGLKALISLAITIVLIIFGLIPLLLLGWSPILLSIATCMLSALLTFAICFGVKKKSVSAFIGVTGGLIIGGITAYIFGVLAKITGFSSGDAQMLQYLPNGNKFDFKGLLFAGIIISASGACHDVAISIGSALTEIKENQPAISDKGLIKSGFNIGKDIMGTMVNTLILAYTGGSLATLLIFIGFGKSFTEIINLESISTEILRAITGSLGLLFAIPITILAYVMIEKFIARRKAKREKPKEIEN